jgi:hypothetical protein
MISSESINYSKYSIINEPNSNSNSISSSIENDSKLVSEENEGNKLMSDSEENLKKDLLYGNNASIISPKFLGKSRGFCYNLNGDPKITIGPDCKFNFLY